MASNIINLVTLLLLLVMSVSGSKVFLSIDCGASTSFTDDNGILWSPDNAYIKTGESRRVSYLSESTSEERNTLRVFKTSIKSCYSINVDKGEQVLVRATFAYGNYDYAYKPPTFNVHLNGEYWVTVVGKIGIYSTGEAIIIAKGGVISVCLVRTYAGQFPYISALELRSLDANMYSRANSDHTLHLGARHIGSNSLTVRYPDDPYDRKWDPTALTPTSSSDTLKAINIKLENNPPVEALQRAVTSYDTNTPISFFVGETLPRAVVPILMIMYFVELQKLDVSDKRSFNVFADSKRLTSTPITPSYGTASEWTFTNFSASATTVFALKATSDSTLPPIVNAFEIYCFDCVSPDPNTSGQNNRNNAGIIVGTIVPIFILVWAIVGVIVIWQHKRKVAVATEMAENGGDTIPDDTSNSARHILHMSNNRSEG